MEKDEAAATSVRRPGTKAMAPGVLRRARLHLVRRGRDRAVRLDRAARRARRAGRREAVRIARPPLRRQRLHRADRLPPAAPPRGGPGRHRPRRRALETNQRPRRSRGGIARGQARQGVPAMKDAMADPRRAAGTVLRGLRRPGVPLQRNGAEALRGEPLRPALAIQAIVAAIRARFEIGEDAARTLFAPALSDWRDA